MSPPDSDCDCGTETRLSASLSPVSDRRAVTPRPEQRREVFKIHLGKRKLEPESFRLDALVAASEGFSGAEIEQGIAPALYAAHAQQRPLAARHSADELRRTRPLSVVMAVRVAGLRAWARPRAVPAD